MNDSLTIAGIDTKPRHDPYQNIDGVVSRTALKLDPRDRTIWVEQEYRDNATPVDEWHGLILTWWVQGHPYEENMLNWIKENNDLWQTICDGYEIRWTGNNHVGHLDDNAMSAYDTVEYVLDNDLGPANYYEYWTVESWLESSRDEITADMTDEQLADLALQWEPTGSDILAGRKNILEFITEIRDTLRWERETYGEEEEQA